LELLHVEGSAFLKGDLRVAGRIVNPLINFGLDGEIGIGVTGDPKGYLHINKDTGTGVDFRPSILLQSPGNGEFSGSLDFRDNIDAGFRFQHRTGGNLTVDLLRSGASVASPPMLTFTHGVGAGQSITDSNARIGIGTDEPEAKLHVEGSMVVKSGLPNRQDGNTDFVKSRISVSDTVANTFEISECLSFQTTPITSDHNRALRSVVWAKELGLFVAVGTARTRQITVVGGATITSYSVGATSPDGISWREASYQLIASLHSEWREVCWSPQRLLFVAVSSSAVGGSSQNSRLATSTDGDSWTDRSVTQSLNCVCWSPERNLFVAMGAGVALRSSDGTTWNPALNNSGNNWTSVAYSPTLNRFVAVAYNSGSNSSVISDNNGVSWSAGNLSDSTWNGVAFGGSVFVAVSDTRIFSSANGITWTSRNTITFGLESVVFGNNIFVAVGYISSDNISYAVVLNNDGSFNGVTLSNSTNLNGRWMSVTFGNNLFVAVGRNISQRRVMTSPDGFNWTSRTTPLDCNLTWTSVTFGNGRFVAVAENGSTSRFMTSTDGITWALLFVLGSNEFSWKSVTFGSGVFVAVGTNTTQNAQVRSTDGLDWSGVVTSSSNPLQAVAFGNGTFIAIGPNIAQTSQNGSTWTARELYPLTPNWVSVTWAAELGLFVAVSDTGTGNRVATSPDGIVWTRRTSAGDRTWRSVTWSPELRLLVAVGWSGSSSSPTGRVMTSPDGITWTAVTPPSRAWLSVVWSRELGLFIAVANAGGAGDRIMTSPDGINWSSRTSPADNQWFSVTWSPELGRAVAVAFSGTNRGMYSRQLQRFASSIEGSQEVSEDMIVKRNINIGQAIMPTPVGDAPLACVRAWVNFNGGSSSSFIRNSFNVRSFTRTGTGVYVVNFIKPMPTSNYVVSTVAGNTGGGRIASLRDGVFPTNGGFTLQTWRFADPAGAVDSEIVHVSVVL
jgi:hypothetical protein